MIASYRKREVKAKRQTQPIIIRYVALAFIVAASSAETCEGDGHPVWRGAGAQPQPQSQKVLRTRTTKVINLPGREMGIELGRKLERLHHLHAEPHYVIARHMLSRNQVTSGK